jgi:hypothetical protein
VEPSLNLLSEYLKNIPTRIKKREILTGLSKEAKDISNPPIVVFRGAKILKITKLTDK